MLALRPLSAGVGPTNDAAMASELRPVVSDDEWEAYHSIRERVLWNARGRVGVYDREHPDERKLGNHPFLLVQGGEPLGVVRVDLEPPVAWFRRVAVREDRQRQGYGRQLLELAQQFAVAHGCRRVCSNVDPAAVGFYRKLGFQERPSERSTTSIAMEKQL